MVWCGMSGLGLEFMAGPGWARSGGARLVLARQGREIRAWLCSARQGDVWRGSARWGLAGRGIQGGAGQGTARLGLAMRGRAWRVDT